MATVRDAPYFVCILVYVYVCCLCVYVCVCRDRYASVYTAARRVVHEPYEKFMNYAKQPLPSERIAAATAKQPQVAVLFFYTYIIA